MPFFSPLWAPGRGWSSCTTSTPRCGTWCSPPRLAARSGASSSRRVAPPIYRRSSIVTLSESSKDELVDEMGFGAEQISVVPPGIDRRYSPGGERSPTPLVVAVGPARSGEAVPPAHRGAGRRAPHGARPRAVDRGRGLRARGARGAARRDVDAEEWVDASPGASATTSCVDLYRRAWVVTSCSAREGWGMTLTEAAACGTPAVVTRIAGHVDAVRRRSRPGSSSTARRRSGRRAGADAHRRRAA